MEMACINLNDERVAMVADELEYQYRLRQAKEVTLGIALDIDDDSMSRLSQQLASRGMRIEYEGGLVYATPIER